MSEAEVSLCRRGAALAVELEQLEAKFSEGAKDADLDLYARCTGHLSRLYQVLGIKRVPKDAITLENYVDYAAKSEAAPTE